MRSKAIALFVPALFIVAACDPGSGPVAPAEGFAGGGGPNGVIASATGSAHRLRNGELWVLAFNAKLRADGTTTGQVRMDRKDVDVSFNVDVTCMSVSGNTAWIAGIIRNQRGDIAIDGTISYFYVIDNGEGANAPPDVASAVRLNDVAGEDLAFCNDQPLLLPASPVERGNVQVR